MAKKTIKKLKPNLTVSCLGRKVPVTFVNPKTASLGEGNLGEFTSLPLGIEIDETLSPESKRRVLVHEMTHAALALSGLAGYHLTEMVEESICTVMESAFEDIHNALNQIKVEE